MLYIRDCPQRGGLLCCNTITPVPLDTYAFKYRYLFCYIRIFLHLLLHSECREKSQNSEKCFELE